MNIKIEYNEQQLKELVKSDLQEKFGLELDEMDKIHIKVKSKQNYKSEWEEAEYKATLDINK